MLTWKKFTFTIGLLFLQFLLGVNVRAQLATYTGSGGSSVAITGYANETVSTLQDVGFGSNTPCSSGGLSGITVNTSWTTYSTSGPRVYLQILPDIGYELNVTGFDAGLRSSNTGPVCARFAYSLDNGTTWIDDGACHAPNIGSCGTTAVSTWSGGALPTAISNTSWGIIIAIFPYLPNSSSGTFQVNTINIAGTVVASNHAPSFVGGTTQSLSVCENIATPINSIMSIDDIDVGQTETWTILSSPAHGALGGFPTTGTSTGAAITPSGLTYTPNAGFTGADVFTIQISDGIAVSTTTVTATVSPGPSAITGLNSVCSGSVISLSDASSSGTWSSNNTSVASVNTATGVVTGVGAGSATISYSDGGFGCFATTTITVNTSPSVVSGVNALCAGTNATLSDAFAGGIWSSDNTAVATISGAGVVYGVSTGTANISYTIGSCSASMVMTVNTLQPITGGSGVCIGSTLNLNDATTGGIWSSGGPTAATVSGGGVVTGVASGSATIYYTLGACYVSQLVTVDYPVAPITGLDTVCVGSATALQDATSGGFWTSSNTSVVSLSGYVFAHGVSVGTADVSYTVGGCSASVSVAVLSSNAGVITGKDSICMGPGHVITLSDSVNGGVWSSSTPLRATVNAVTGVVTGAITGVDTIKYTVTNSCGTFVAKFILHVRTATQCATGIDETAGTLTEFKAYPNPTNGLFTMELVADYDEDVQVMVTNIVGQKVKEFVTKTNRATDVRLEYVPGIYFLCATTSRGRYVTKVIIN